MQFLSIKISPYHQRNLPKDEASWPSDTTSTRQHPSADEREKIETKNPRASISDEQDRSAFPQVPGINYTICLELGETANQNPRKEENIVRLRRTGNGIYHQIKEWDLPHQEGSFTLLLHILHKLRTSLLTHYFFIDPGKERHSSWMLFPSLSWRLCEGSNIF